jgi:transcriptional regulator NrdR family protein
MATTVFNRRSTFGIHCVRSDNELIAPERSEYRNGTHIRHRWFCSKCAARFESIEQIPVEVMTTDDILPSTVVA